jgi:glycosyltransferase involved in cell wall biosynthesis
VTTPAFTAVIAAYNEEAFVADAIRSVLAQTRDDFELVVIDDGSTDRTAAVVKGFESDRRLKLISQSNRGLGASLNAGIAAARAPYVSLLDADDLWMPTYLERMGEALDADESAALAYTEAWWFNQARGRFFRQSTSEYAGAPSVPPGDPEAFLIAVMPANWVFGLPTLRRSALEQIGGFNEGLGACEDYELWIRVLAAGYRAVRVPGRLAIQRDRGGSMSKEQRSMAANLRKVYAIAADLPGVPEEARAIARRRVAELDRLTDALSRGSRRLAARRAIRSQLGRIHKAVLARRIWYPETPPEVATAFPDFDWDARPAI